MPRIKIQIAHANDRTPVAHRNYLTNWRMKVKFDWLDAEQLGNCYEVAGQIFITLAEGGHARVGSTFRECSQSHRSTMRGLNLGGWVIDFSSARQRVIEKNLYYETNVRAEAVY